MIGRLRLIDAVVIAAVALLCLKVLGLASGARTSQAPPENDKLRVTVEQNKAFAHALARARTNYEPPDVTMTNAVKKPDEASPQNSPGGAGEGTGGGPAAAPAVSGSAAATAEPSLVPPSPTERVIMERLGERRDEWQQKGKDLDLRERMLEDVHRKLEARINDLKSLEEKAEAEAAKRGESETANLKNLVTMYETMKPKEAARVFDRLPHDVLVPVVLQMNPRKMAEVLAVMAPEAAERLTIALATRNRPRTEAASTRTSLPANELPAIDPPVR
jgi:flagellar motility protein MotE (MotC chaperone)